MAGARRREVRLAVVRDGCKRNRLISELALRNTLSHRASPMRVSRLSLTLSMTHCSNPPTFFRLVAAALTLSLRTDKLNSRCREIANVSTVTRCKQALVYRWMATGSGHVSRPAFLPRPAPPGNVAQKHIHTQCSYALGRYACVDGCEAGRGLFNGQRPFRVSFAQSCIR